jgi:diguanylate cyclase (GGDEF)-like protein/PAS domain S-box-containing protein
MYSILFIRPHPSACSGSQNQMPVTTEQVFALLQRHFGVWVYSVSETLLDYDPAWLGGILGRDETNIRSPRAFLRLVHPVDRCKLIKKYRHLCAGSTVNIGCELRLRCPGGHDHRIEIHAVAAICDAQGNRPFITGTAASIHARTQQEESLYDLCQKLQSSETRYRALLHDARSPIIVMDSDTRTIVDVNNATSTVSGYSKEELLHMKMNDLIEMPKRRYDLFSGNTKSAGSGEDSNLKCKSGMKIAVDISCSNVSVQGRNLTQCIFHDISLRKHTEETLRFMANHDPLTRLPNRNLLARHLEQALHRARKGSHVVAVCFVDLNKFKQVNDIFGHEAGDTILKNFAARLSSSIRSSDIAARLGGDEFIFILDNLNDADAAVKIVRKIIPRLDLPYGIEEKSIEVNCSIGISTYPAAGTTALELMHTADKAMYHAKNNGMIFYLWPAKDAGNGRTPPRI